MMAKTTQATRNIRKFVKRQSSGVKGRMITDDYGNRYSTKASGGRRHTLSRGKERAIRLGGDNVTDGLRSHKVKINIGNYYRKMNTTRPSDLVEAIKRRRHSVSAVRRQADYQDKAIYHDGRSSNDPKKATRFAKRIHGTKRKPKDFTK